jgi:hypothetical protein
MYLGHHQLVLRCNIECTADIVREYRGTHGHAPG